MHPDHDQEKWLERNTGFCQRFKARLTKQACQKYKEITTAGANWRAVHKSGGSYNEARGSGLCDGCHGINIIAKKEDEGMAKKGICNGCGREITIAARGMCARCLKKSDPNGQKKKKTKNITWPGDVIVGRRPPLTKGGDPQKPEVLIGVPFVAADMHLYRELKKRAIRARRSPEQQLLFILEQLFSSPAPEVAS